MNRLYIIVSVLVVSSVVARGERKAFLDVETILEAWEAAYGSVESMHVVYSEHVLSATPPVDNPDALEGLVLVHHVDRYEAGVRYHTRNSISEGEIDANTLMEHAFNGKTTSDYWGKEKRGTINRGLTGRNTETMNHVKQYLLMDQRPVSGELEKYFPDKTAPQLSKCIRLGSMYLGVRVLPNLERVADDWCHVIDIGFKEGSNFSMKVWMAHNKNMIPLKYVKELDGRIIEKMDVLEIGVGETDSGSTYFPKVAQRFTDVEGHGIIQYKLDTRLFEPDIKIGSDEFSLSFPNGTLVRDWTIEMQYVVGGGGNIDELTLARDLRSPNKVDMQTDHASGISLRKMSSDVPQGQKILIGDTNMVLVDIPSVPINTISTRSKKIMAKVLGLVGLVGIVGIATVLLSTCRSRKN